MIFIDMSNIKDIISSLLGKIYLRKPAFFGLDTEKITFVVSPSMKIFALFTSPKKLKDRVPFEENRLVDLNDIKKWADENGYDITFKTELPSMARRMMTVFGENVVEEARGKRRELKFIVMEELEKSALPDHIKEWAKQNPEKFVQNLKTIQEMLKK